MSKTTAPLAGRIIWHEVHTKDVEATIKFYGELLGWTTLPEERDSYIHFYLGDKTVAGVMPIEGASPIPPHWAIYVGSDNVEGYIARAEAAGGKPMMPMVHLPEVGKFSAIADIEGAVLTAFAPKNVDNDSYQTSGAPGTFCWAELLCKDTDAAREFYGKVVGWEMRSMDMGDGAIYTILAPEGAPEGDGVGGIQPMPADDPGPSCWLPYVAVEDIDALTAKVLELGGAIQVPPTDILGKGRFSIVADHAGSVFAMYWSAPH
jgi:predicted enzyme related to lactoylglutathione lyase